jgi:serine/threonine protein kinase
LLTLSDQTITALHHFACSILQALIKNFKELFPPQWLLTTFKLGKELGRGVFGAVYAATIVDNDQFGGRQLAVKQQIIKLSGGITNLRKALVSFVSEFKMYMHLGKESAVVTTHGGNIELCDNLVICSIVMEQAPMTLHSFLKKEEAVPLPKKLQIVTELLGLLRFLERQELCHSDIKVINTFSIESTCSANDTLLHSVR